MELFIFFIIAALGGFWYINHVLKTKNQKPSTEVEPQAPYKVEPVTEVKNSTPEEFPKAEVKVEPVVEAKPKAVKPKAPRKPRQPKQPVAKKAAKATKTTQAKTRKQK